MVDSYKHSVNDIEFIDRVKKSDLARLEVMLIHFSGPKSPRWKRVAIRRAISKFKIVPLGWVLGLDEINCFELSLPKFKELNTTVDRLDGVMVGVSSVDER